MNKSCNPGDSIRDLVIPDSWRSRFIFEWGHVNSPSQKRSQIESIFLNPRDPILNPRDPILKPRDPIIS